MNIGEARESYVWLTASYWNHSHGCFCWYVDSYMNANKKGHSIPCDIQNTLHCALNFSFVITILYGDIFILQSLNSFS